MTEQFPVGISDDLAPLLVPSAGPGVRFGQGLVTAWNAITGENTIEWAGGVLTNVPVLNTGEAIALKAGHVVGMLGQGATWFIIGRITPANDPNFASASLAFAAKTAQATGFALATSLATVASVTLDVPPWADEAAVIATAACSLVNTRTSADFASAQTFIDGDGGPGSQTGFSIGSTGNANQWLQPVIAAHSRVLVPGGSTITCEVKVRSQGAAWPTSATNSAGISAMAIFRSTT
jgi:hypothetical protein